MSALPQIKWTRESYLAFERASEEKHEFVDGQVYAMSGAKQNHSLIIGSAGASLHGQLRKRPLNTYLFGMRLKTLSGMYAYPDVSIASADSELEDEFQDTLLNPTVIIEVLSPSTEHYDRGKKFQHYRTLESLQEYVLIAQDAPRIELYTRQPNDTWLLSDASQLDATIELTSIQCTLALADVYEKVNFDETQEEQSGE